ncbi:MAG TPA: hypothetical protein VHO06_21700, partial [Polyangia bacterium]|nr:hypothetical protein [Polyangia bacterium]
DAGGHAPRDGPRQLQVLMRPARYRALVPVAAVAASTVLVSCHRADSILLVEVAGDPAVAPTSLSVTVEASQGGERTFTVTPQGGAAIALPTSLSVELAPSLTGPVTVIVEASAGGLTIASGTATLDAINVGGETIVVVTLDGGTPEPADAGSDAASATGGTGAGGTSGTDGSGTGGTAGTGGAAGTGGKGGASGAGGVSGAGGRVDAGGDA